MIEVRVSTSSDQVARFRKPEKFLEWLQSEIAFWQWVQNIGGNNHENIQNSYLQVIRKASQSLSGQIEGADEDKISAATQAANRVNAAVETLEYIPSSDPFAKFVDKVRSDDPNTAAYCVLLRTRKSHNGLVSTTQRLLKASVLVTLYDLGLADVSKGTTKTQIDELASKLESTVSESVRLHDESLAALREQVEAYETAARETLDELQEYHKIKSKDIEEQKRKIGTAFNRSLSDEVKKAKGQIANFIDYYEKQIALEGPVSYWGRKRGNHRWATIALALAFIGYSSALIILTKGWLDDLPLGGRSLLQFFGDLGLEGFAIITLVVGIGLIGSRIIYRLFSSQLHLWNDAAERVTMIQTYLALSKRGHAKEQHLEALMIRLFAPASDGVVKDEMGAASLFDLLLSRSTK